MAWLDDNPNPTLNQQRIGRREAVSGVFVAHSAENTPDHVAFDGGAEAVRDYIGRRDSYGSYHFLADSDSRPQLVEWWNEAFHDATDQGNWHEIGGSIATRADVLPLAPQAWRDAAIDNLAQGFANAARWLKGERGIIVPARRITREESQRRVPGFIAHGSRDPGRRSDPGFDQNPELWDQFLSRYRFHAADVLGTRPTPTPTPQGFLMALSDADQKKLLDLTVQNNMYLKQLQAEVVAALGADGTSRMDRIAKTLDNVSAKVGA